MHCLDNGLTVCIVVDGAPGFHHAAGQCGLGNNAARPNLILQLVFYALAILGYFLRKTSVRLFRIFVIPYYFCIVNIASLLGIIQAMFGVRHTMWNVSRSESQQSANQ